MIRIGLVTSIWGAPGPGADRALALPWWGMGSEQAVERKKLNANSPGFEWDALT